MPPVPILVTARPRLPPVKKPQVSPGTPVRTAAAAAAAAAVPRWHGPEAQEKERRQGEASEKAETRGWGGEDPRPEVQEKREVVPSHEACVSFGGVVE